MKRTVILIFLMVLFPINMVSAVTPVVKEFSAGNRVNFSTAEHPKSEGINMALSYPNSWLAMEGDQKHIVQQFVNNDGGQGVEMAVISIKPLPLPTGTVLTERELKNKFTSEKMKEWLPTGATFINAKPTTIAGVPAGILEYSTRQESQGMTIDTQSISYIFVYDNIMVTLGCSVLMQSTTPDILSRQMDNFKPLFLLMANSISLQKR